MVDFRAFFISQNSQGGYSGINMTGGGGGVRCIFLGLKFSTSVFFWVEHLTMYFWGSKKSAHFFGFEFPSG